MPERRHGASRPTSKVYNEYQVWKAMKRRCFYKKDKHFQDYAGRGITVCDRWLKFENFIEDMGPCPEGKSLDRINNSGNYEPSNCRWADKKTQARNKRNVEHLTVDGITRPAFELAKMNGIKRSTYSMRVHYGWTVYEAAFGRQQGGIQ